MADPTRRRILRMLSEAELSAGDIAKEFSMSAPSVSHHLSVLKGADLIQGRREGQQIFYALNTTVVQDLLAVFLDVFSGKEQSTQEERNEFSAKRQSAGTDLSGDLSL